MIRLVFCLRRQSHLDLESFQIYWRTKHAALVAGFADDLNVLRYVQTHRIEDPITAGAQKARGDMEPAHDGVAELWWESEAALAAALSSSAGQAAGKALLDDEATFIDLPNSPLWLAHEYPQVNPTPENIIARTKSSVLRVFFPLRQQPSISDADARRYWLTEHGPIVRSHAAAVGMLCYRQVHRTDSDLTQSMTQARNTQVAPYLGHAETWIDRTRNATPEARVGNQAFIADEHNFIDMTRSTIWVGKEHSIIDRR